jgi:hypothetical protein
MVTAEYIWEAFTAFMQGKAESDWKTTLAEIDAALGGFQVINFDEVAKHYCKGKSNVATPATADFLYPQEETFFIELKSLDDLYVKDAKGDVQILIKKLKEYLTIQDGRFVRKVRGSLTLFVEIISDPFTAHFYFVFAPHNHRQARNTLSALQADQIRFQETMRKQYHHLIKVEIITGERFKRMLQPNLSRNKL